MFLIFSILVMGCSESDSTLPVSKEAFCKWRSPKRGTANPEVMTNPVWAWIIKEQLNGYQANETMGGPDSFDAGPCWSADRFGQSKTELPDGRVLEIAGEHEDSYDPDFFIYNDVFVHHPDGTLAILGYDEVSFPPTDFHSATLVGDAVWLVGNLGYPHFRRPGETQVLKLDLGTMKISVEATKGELPGWIHRHEAKLGSDGKSIVISGGLIDDGSDLLENIDEWELNLESLIWKRLTRKTWARWIFTRENGDGNELWEARKAEWEKELGKEFFEPDENLPKREFDLTILENLYKPGVPHEEIPRGADDDYNLYRLEIDGVVVCYDEGSHRVNLTVEGDLSADTVAALVNDLKQKLTDLEKVSYSAIDITYRPLD